MRPDDIDFHSPRRQEQLRQIREALPRLVSRDCACGCGMGFRVFAESHHVYASLSCAGRNGWNGRNLFGSQGQFQTDRTWHTGVPIDREGILPV